VRHRGLEGVLVSVVTRFLLGDPDAMPTLASLRESNLVGLAASRLAEHPQHADLREYARGVAFRHLAIKRELFKLVQGWREAGIETMLLKGFFLAEFAYATASERTYADVDVLVHGDDVGAACTIALRCGWDEHWRTGEADSPFTRRDPHYRGHEVAQLHHRSLGLTLDLQHRAAHNNHNMRRPPNTVHHVTSAVWQRARTTAWEGTMVTHPDPVDAIVVGIVLNRCWGSDDWALKPRDYADVQTIAARFGVERDDVVERARELGVARTLDLYLQRCDPYRSRLDLRAPTWFQRRWWNLLVGHERGSRDIVQGGAALADALRGGALLLSVLPDVIGAARTQRGGSALPPQRAAAAPARALGFRSWRDTKRAIHRAMRLLRVHDAERAEVATTAAFRVLSRRGVAVEVRVERSADGDRPRLYIEGHAVEVVVTPDL
jgi:hypothetical protein